jgi:hypothetical protein
MYPIMYTRTKCTMSIYQVLPEDGSLEPKHVVNYVLLAVYWCRVWLNISLYEHYAMRLSLHLNPARGLDCHSIKMIQTGCTWMEFGRKSDFLDWFFVGLLSTTRQMSQCFLEIGCDPFLFCCDSFMNMPAIGNRRPTVWITYSVVKWINIGNMAEIEM